MKPEILKIIEGGVERDVVKVKAYAKLLKDKSDDKRFAEAIQRRLDGTYKNQPHVVLRKGD